jgi:hypothetical protein
MSDQHRDMTDQESEAYTVQALKEFTDILNQHGEDSPELTAFYTHHQEDAEVLQLCNTAVKVRTWLLGGGGQ